MFKWTISVHTFALWLLKNSPTVQSKRSIVNGRAFLNALYAILTDVCAGVKNLIAWISAPPTAKSQNAGCT